MMIRRLHARYFPGSAPAPAIRSVSVPEHVPDAVAAPVPVPVRVVARRGGVIEVENQSDSVLHQVRFALAGSGVLGLSLPRTLEPGDRLRVVLRTAEPHRGHAADAVLVMRWFQPDGEELLWPIAL